MKNTTTAEVHINSTSAVSVSFEMQEQIYFDHTRQMQALRKIRSQFPTYDDNTLKKLMSDALLSLFNRDYVRADDIENGEGVLPAVALNVVYSMQPDIDSGYCSNLLVDVDLSGF